MPAPTTSIYLNSTTPAAPTGNQNVKPQTDGAAPEQSISFYPQQATPDLLGVVKPDGTSITVDETGTISSTSTLTAPVLLITPTTETEGLIIRGSDTIAAGWVQGTSYVLPIAGDSGGDLTETVAFSSPVTAGNAIVVIVSGADGETDDLTITDSLSNSYTQIALCNQVTVFVALNIAGGANTVSIFGNPLTAGCALIAEYAGLVTSSSLDTDNTLYYDSFAEVTPSAPNLTMTTSASDLIITIYASDEVCTPGAAEYTTRLTASNSADGSGTLCLADTTGSAGSYTADWTSTSFSNMWSALLIGLKGSPSSTQVAPLAVFEDASGDTLSEVNAQGQIVLPSTSGMPTNSPLPGALAYNSTSQEPVIYNGSAWESIDGTVALATTSAPGIVQPDGTTITISSGIISAVGGMIYPGAGIPNSTGTAWGTSYTVGNSGSDIPQLSSGLLNPSVLPIATTSVVGAVQPDGTTITISGGIITAVGGGGGGGGALVLLEEQTASSSATLDFTSWFDTNYDEYEIHFAGVNIDTSGAILGLRMSTNGGSSYDSTNGNYQWAFGYVVQTAEGEYGSGDKTRICLGSGGDSTGNYPIVGVLKVYGLGSSAYKQVVGQILSRNASDPTGPTLLNLVAGYLSNAVVDAFQVQIDEGTFSGAIRVYGVSPVIGGSGSGGGGALVLLQELTASNSTSLDFTDWYSTSYDSIFIELVSVTAAISGVGILMQVSTNGGTSWDADSNYNFFDWSKAVNAGSYSGYNQHSGMSAFQWWGPDANDNSGSGFSGAGYLFNVTGSNVVGEWRGIGQNTVGGWYEIEYGVQYSGTGPVNGLRFSLTSGNIASGTIRIYGVSNSAGGGGNSVPTLATMGLSTAYNQTDTFSATNTATGVALMDTVGTSGANNEEGIVAAYPGEPFTVTANVSIAPRLTNYWGIAFVILNTLSSESITLGLISNSGYGSGVWAQVAAYNSPTSFNTMITNAALAGVGPSCWIRLQDDGTNLSFSVSSDGNYWQPLWGPVSKSSLISSYLSGGGMNYFGLAIDPVAQGSFGTGSTILAWELTTP